jgi:hypothetical protein
MKTIVLVAAVCLSVFASVSAVVAPFIGGVPGDLSFCAVSDGTYLYQGSNSDYGKIIKIKMSDLSRVGEYIMEDASFLCPGAIDASFENLFFIATKDGKPAIVKVDVGLTTHTTVNLDTTNKFFSDLFAVGTSLYALYQTVDGTSIIQVKQSDLSQQSTAVTASGITSGLVNGNTVVLVDSSTSKVIRFNLATMSLVDSRVINADITDVISHTVNDDYIIFGHLHVVTRYDLATLTNPVSLPSFEPNIVRVVQVDPFNRNVVHVFHRFTLGGRDQVMYPYNYLRVTVDTFQPIDIATYEIEAILINQPSFLNVYADMTFFMYPTRGDLSPYANVPILTKVDLDATTKETFIAEQQGSEYITRVDVAQNALIMTSSYGYFKKPLNGGPYQYATLPVGSRFSDFREAGIISADQQYGYYAINNAIVKIKLSDLSIVETRPVSFAASGTWLDAIRAGDNLYFYFGQLGLNSKIIRYEYNSDVTSSPASLEFDGNDVTLAYTSAVSSDGNKVFMGIQTTTGGLFIIRFNYATGTVDKSLALQGINYIVGMKITNDDKFLVITTSQDTYKIDANTLAISKTLSGSGFRLDGVVVDKANKYAYLGGFTNDAPVNIYKVDLPSFTIVETYTGDRASSSLAAYDSCTDTAYFVGYLNFIYGQSGVRANIAYVGQGGECTSGPTSSPSTVAPSTSAPSTSAPSTQAPSTSSPSTAAPSSTASLSTSAPSTSAPSASVPSTSSSASPSTSTTTTKAPSTGPTGTTQTPETTKPGTNLSGDNNSARQSNSATNTISYVGFAVSMIAALLL